MAATSRYRIADEPVAGRLGGVVVNPFWPLLAGMVAGFWLAFPWFVVNALAMGSATRRREIAWVAGGAAVSAAAGAALLWALRSWPVQPLRYAYVVLVAWRLGVAYVVFTLQSPSFELHEYFGGRARNGALLAIAAAVFPLQGLVGREASVLLTFLVG